MNFKKIKKFGKYLAGIVAASAIASFSLIPALGINADGPRFNFLEGDWELFKGVNTSKDETVWKDPITVDAGETFEGLIYYHNGIVDSVARNTTVKVGLPATSTGDSVRLNATIGADNAETVSDTVIDDVINGISGLNVNLNQNVNLEYVPGSVKWYPNSHTNPNVSEPLPNGQDGSELFTSTGLNIGDINGCWEYAGFVKFAIRTRVIANNNISIVKTVRNVSDNQSDYAKSTNADQGETVEYKLAVNSNGNTSLENVTVKDQLPSDLTVVANSAKLTKNGLTTSISETDLLSSGVNIGEMTPGQIETASIVFDATVPSQITTAKTVVNTGRVVAGSLNDQDTANVVLNAGNIDIVKSKSAFNLTQNVNATSVSARTGDVIEYTLRTKNNGSLATSYVVTDGVADILEYADMTSISDGGILIDGAAGTNEAKTVSYPSQALSAGQEVTNTFKITVKSTIPSDAQNGYHYDYKMYNLYGNDVTVTVEKPVLKPVLSVLKYVRNVTSNELDYVKADTAYAGDTLEYKIVFKNSGEGSADYVKVYDVLPANVSFDSTSAAILGMGGSEKSIAENMGNGYIVKTLGVGEEGYIRFRVTTSAQIAAGEDLKNTAYVEDDGKTISDIAETVIKQKIVPAKYVETPLPRTGSDNAVMIAFLVAMAATGGLALSKGRP